MKRLSLVVFIIGVFLLVGNTTAQTSVDVEEWHYRTPIIGTGFDITRFECPFNGSDHDSYGSEAGLRFMDINVHGAGATDEGTPIYSSGDGTVREVNTDEGLVRIDDGQVGFRYAHMAKIYVETNHPVTKGQLIGYMGGEGLHGNTPHLHWEIYPMSGYTIDPMEIQGVEENLPGGDCDTVSSVDGTMWGDSIHQWDSCEEFHNWAIANGVSDVVLFDHKDCRGNYLVFQDDPPYGGQIGLNLASNFNDRTRSIYVPPNRSVIVSAHADNPLSHYLCSSVDMWNVDEDAYWTDSNMLVGWQGAPGWNMLSYITVPDTPICPSQPDVAGFIVASPYSVGSYNSTIIGTGTVTPTPTVGNAHVDIYENTNFQPAQYGWDNPTGGWVNLSSVANYLDNQTSSIQLDASWSMMGAQENLHGCMMPNGN